MNRRRVPTLDDEVEDRCPRRAPRKVVTVMELSIGLPDGLLMNAGDGSELTLYEADHCTVRRRIDCSVLKGARMADIVWSHKLSAVVAAVPERHRLYRWDAYTDELQEWAGTGEPGRRDGTVSYTHLTLPTILLV